MVSSDTQLALQSDVESPLSTLLYDLSQQVQGVMESMLKMTNEIDQHSAGIMEEIERCKDTVCERKKALDEEKDRFQKAAYTVLDLLNNRLIS
ncbi:hypothetical protein DCAR_0101443 [Daucus carota subsp. sativus]|uniref:Uncharacterized protein n=1 Tax=Daucus carota subsp. sativus TaxID=79200 RepID=A0AAF0W2Y1_DAUCS|nr:PREDICTED: uncharacterized protein LOC108194628 isoform X2 [Daucus carota subsp. sativus]WOG82280.1 hypothetical protein DCAR_0101443 [Daucus carota subsp. sativus]